MAFDISRLKLGRGNYNCDATSLNSAIHNYTTPDFLSTIKTAGYFPNYLGYDEAAVKAGDILQVNSWGTGDAIQDELSFNFAILNAAPMVLAQLDQLLYNTYTVSYSGGATGNLTVSFSRDFSGIVYMQVITTTTFNVTASNFITCAFTVPSQFLPDPATYGASGVTVVVPTVNSLTFAPYNMDINVNENVNGGIVFKQSPNLPFLNVPVTLAVRNYYVPYIGKPL